MKTSCYFTENGYRKASTLVEMLVTAAILILLMALALPAIQKVRSTADTLKCQMNLSQLGIALHSYHTEYHKLPSGCSYQNGKSPQPHMSWLTRLLPYIEHDTLWSKAIHAYSQEAFFETPPHYAIMSKVITLFTCPSDERVYTPKTFGPFSVGFTSYMGVSGTNRTTYDGVFYLDSTVRFTSITDGLSYTLAIGERPPSNDLKLGWWYAGWGQRKDGSAEYHLGVREINDVGRLQSYPKGPYEYVSSNTEDPTAVFHYWSLHPGGANFLYASGSVKFLPYSANVIMPALATRSGKEAIYDD